MNFKPYEYSFESIFIHGITTRKGQSVLSAVLRREEHRNYKGLGDQYVRKFLKHLAIKHRNKYKFHNKITEMRSKCSLRI
ncbi:MAG: DUF1456 family protein [Clostridiales bacterium]|nr:DUF1456 family protein [Clostridiales bacterium]